MAPTAPHQRRPRRVGQIIPREHPEDLSKCRKWLLRVFLGCAGGKRQYYNKVIHGLRRDAQAHLSAKLTEKDTGRLVKRTRETLDSYLHRWLRDVAPMTRKPRTVSHDEENLRLYVRPYLGKYRLDQITPVHVQEMLRRLVDRGLAPKTIRNARTTLSTALKHAVQPERLITFNPVLGTRAPRLRKKSTKAWTAMETVKFLKAAEDDRYEALYYLAIYTGMRPEEYLGLQRRDVDFAAGTVTVNRILVNDHGRKLYYDDDPKTDSSRRTLLVPEPALTKLKAWMLAAPEKLREPKAPVFHDPKRGGPLNERNLRRRHFRPLCRKAGVPEIRLYDLRHTFGSLMHRAKVPMKDYGEMMGHSSITVTADIYTHLDPEAQREAAEKFAAFLKEAEQQPA